MKSQQGAFLNTYHEQMAMIAFGVHAWSYYQIDPMKLIEQMNEQAQPTQGGDVSTEQRVRVQP